MPSPLKTFLDKIKESQPYNLCFPIQHPLHHWGKLAHCVLLMSWFFTQNTKILPNIWLHSAVPCEMWTLFSLWWLCLSPVCTAANMLPLPSLRPTHVGNAATLQYTQQGTPLARLQHCLSLHSASGPLVSHHVRLLLLTKVDLDLCVWLKWEGCVLNFFPQPQNCLWHSLVLGVVGIIADLNLNMKKENENLYNGHKNLHTKMVVFTEPDAQYARVGTHKLTVLKTFIPTKYTTTPLTPKSSTVHTS